MSAPTDPGSGKTAYQPRRAAVPVHHPPPLGDPFAGTAPAGVPAKSLFEPEPAGSTGRPTTAEPAPRPARTRWGRVVLLTAVLSLLFGGVAGAGTATWLSGRDVDTAATPTSRTTAANPAEHTSQAPPPVPAGDQSDITAVAEAVLPSTVTIQVRSGSAASSGSGIVLDRDGHILTNNHVIEDGASGAQVDVVLTGGARVRAEIVGRSAGYDLAVIKVPAGDHLVPAVIGDSAAARTGQLAIAVGSPLGLGGSVTAGIISARDRPVRVGDNSSADAAAAYINALQTDASINPGNSGGPLVDGSGRVIGVNSAILTLGGRENQTGSIGVGFAIPINQAMTIVGELKANGEARYPVIGAQVRDTADESGVELTEVTADGPAHAAGLRAGDKVIAVSGKAVYGSTELIVQIRTHRPGDTVTIDYVRGGRETSVDVTLDGRVG